MSYGTIVARNRDAAKDAAEYDRRPFRLLLDEIGNVPPFPFPYLGDPEIWNKDGEYIEVETFFVDSSGFGGDREPALSASRFLEEVRALIHDHEARKQPVYWAIVSVGQFQVYVQAFVKA